MTIQFSITEEVSQTTNYKLYGECIKYHMWSVRPCLITTRESRLHVPNMTTTMSTPATLMDVPPKPRGRRGKELTPEMRARICELRSIGWSYRKIQARHSTIPLSTIVSTCKREHDRVGQKSNPRSGAPRKTTKDGGDRMVEIPKFKEPDIQSKKAAVSTEEADVGGSLTIAPSFCHCDPPSKPWGVVLRTASPELALPRIRSLNNNALLGAERKVPFINIGT